MAVVGVAVVGLAVGVAVVGVAVVGLAVGVAVGEWPWAQEIKTSRGQVDVP